MYYINNATNTLSKKQPINKEQESSSTREMETLQNQKVNNYIDKLSYQDEHWKIATAHKKCKIISSISAMKISDVEKQQWLQDIAFRNSLGLLIKEINADPKEKVTTHIVKSSPIYVMPKQ